MGRRRIELGASLEGAAFRLGDQRVADLADARLRHLAFDRPHRGVRSIGLGDSLVERCRAYSPLLRSSDVFSHATAAGLLGAPLPLRVQLHASLHVSAILATRPRGRGIIGHELDAVERWTVGGLPIPSPAQVWCQLATAIGRDELVAVGDYLVSGIRRKGGERTTPLSTISALADAVAASGGRRGVAALRWALPLVRTGVDSPTESRLRLIICAHGLPEPVIGHPVLVARGLILHPDLSYPDLKIAIEYEGDEHRTDQGRWRRDIRRRELLKAAGWEVICATADDLADPSTIIGVIRAAILAATR